MKPNWYLLTIALYSIGATAMEPEQSETEREQLAALMEFIGGWEQHDSEWLNPMNLEPEQDKSEVDAKTSHNGKQNDE